METLHLDGHTLRRHGMDVGLHQISDSIRVLIRNQAEAHLRSGLGWEHGLCAFAGVARVHSAHVAGGSDPQALQGGVAGLSRQSRCTDRGAEVVLVEVQGPDGFAGVRVPGGDVVIEARHGNGARFVVQRSDDGSQGVGRIGDGASVRSRVKITRRCLNVDLQVREAAEGRQQRGLPWAVHGRVGNDHGIARQALPVRLHEGQKVGRPHLLFALGHHHDVHR